MARPRRVRGTRFRALRKLTPPWLRHRGPRSFPSSSRPSRSSSPPQARDSPRVARRGAGGSTHSRFSVAAGSRATEPPLPTTHLHRLPQPRPPCRRPCVPTRWKTTRGRAVRSPRNRRPAFVLTGACAPRPDVAALACPSGSLITSVSFANYGLPASGSCEASYKPDYSCAKDISPYVTSLCVGSASCDVSIDYRVLGDPCPCACRRARAARERKLPFRSFPPFQLLTRAPSVCRHYQVHIRGRAVRAPLAPAQPAAAQPAPAQPDPAQPAPPAPARPPSACRLLPAAHRTHDHLRHHA